MDSPDIGELPASLNKVAFILGNKPSATQQSASVEQGKILRLIAADGYGLLISGDGQTLPFFREPSRAKSNWTKLKEGMRVLFSKATDAEGQFAVLK